MFCAPSAIVGDSSWCRQLEWNFPEKLRSAVDDKKRHFHDVIIFMYDKSRDILVQKVQKIQSLERPGRKYILLTHGSCCCTHHTILDFVKRPSHSTTLSGNSQ